MDTTTKMKITPTNASPNTIDAQKEIHGHLLFFLFVISFLLLTLPHTAWLNHSKSEETKVVQKNPQK